ncbi:uncharacterized protein N7473_005673 [Penicillium subrubescens]|uniref:uncharacterized protein n=1 Tax=Penicillium subrubescens TaxID=1316194 RepID=UPI0025452CBD|nr:uncharacterized protein N7473_005673 [Penicillium subrubescens]KAJ5896274.1 hypothetical protein N7473_005673 [Penicillium subrubescens]
MALGLRDGQGDALACANCRWNGKFRRCSLWQQEQTPETLAALKIGPRPSVDNKIREAIMSIAQCRGQMQKVARTLKETVADPFLGFARTQVRMLNSLASQLDASLAASQISHDKLISLGILPASQ